MHVVHVMNHNIVLVGHKKLWVKRRAVINHPLTTNHNNHLYIYYTILYIYMKRHRFVFKIYIKMYKNLEMMYVVEYYSITIKTTSFWIFFFFFYVFKKKNL
jgi:hypothetical protein